MANSRKSAVPRRTRQAVETCRSEQDGNLFLKAFYRVDQAEMLSHTPERIDSIRNIEALREFIREMLCAKENLVSEQFPINETVLRRGEQSCGLHFLLFGPRSIRLGAIWAADHNVVYFYAANGERYLKVQLKHRIQTASLATAS